MRILCLGLILSFFPLLSEAKHIIGGEIFYNDQGGGNYLVTLNVYCDCSINPIIPFDKPASIMVYDGVGIYVQTITISLPDSFLVPPTITNPCFAQPGGVCVYGATYTATVNLPPKAGGYYLVYQRCCRNATILNINNSGSVGTTYMEHIPGPELVATNSSPRFDTYPPIYICGAIDIDFDNSAIDPDGDVLVYSFCDPFTGLEPCCPLLNVAGQVAAGANCTSMPLGTICPVNGGPPPYSMVPYISPYSGAYPLSSNPAMTIDPNTGHISGTPNITGQYVVGVCVKEYRGGVLIGTHLRDFQFNVVNCQNLIRSVIQQQTQKCDGLTVQFTNLSSGGVGYFWDFGDLTTLADTLSIKNPTYAYPDTGKYTITLILLGPNPSCNDTSTQTFYVLPLLAPSFVPPAGQCIVGNSFNFTTGGQFASYSTFFWNFTGFGTPLSSALQNPTGISYNQYGSFPVLLTVTQKICIKTFVDTVHVYPNTVAQFQIDIAKGCQPLTVAFYDLSTFGTGQQFLWNFGDGTTSTQQNPIHVYQDTGKFNVTLIVSTTAGCIGSSTFTVNGLVTVYPGPKTGFSLSPTQTDIYHNIITFIDSSKNVTVQTVTMGDGTTLNFLPLKHSYGGCGPFKITQTASSSNGCSDTTVRTLIIDCDYTFYVPNSFSPNNDAHNSVFKCKSFGIYDFGMEIFDRWGKLLFKTNDPEEGWDGMYHGKRCLEDVYVYKIEYTNIVDMYPRVLHGKVSLIK